jgi:hypothetical protein
VRFWSLFSPVHAGVLSIVSRAGPCQQAENANSVQQSEAAVSHRHV